VRRVTLHQSVFHQVNVQFAPGIDLDRGKALVAAVPGVVRVRQVFPDQDDQELRRMFVVDVELGQKDKALAALQSSNLVEEAELVPQRGISPRVATPAKPAAAKG
jgi:hypothetical protein